MRFEREPRSARYEQNSLKGYDSAARAHWQCAKVARQEGKFRSLTYLTAVSALLLRGFALPRHFRRGLCSFEQQRLDVSE